MTVRGNPGLKVRLESELYEETHQAFPSVKGRSGGVSLAIRRLLYLALNRPMPKQFGEIGRSREVDALEDSIRDLAAGDSASAAELAEYEARARVLLSLAQDHVDTLRLHAILGRLLLLRDTPPNKS